MSGVKKVVLPNGLRIILAREAQSFAASVLILVEAGSEYETKRTNGLSHFLEHMTFKGTTNRPRPGMIAEELAGLGAQSNAFTTQEFTGYWAKAEASKLPKVIEIVSDLYLNPLFVAGEIEKERGVIIEELNMYEDMPMRKVQDLFLSLMYGDQPAGWEVGGGKNIIRKLVREDFVKYRKERYVMPGTVLVVAGKFNEKKVLSQVRGAFGRLTRRVATKKPVTRDRQAGPKTLLKFKKSDQGHLVVGFRAFDIFDKRRYALHVLVDVLGGGMSSRLWKRVREELGAAYYISAEGDFYIDHGVLGISAGVDHAKIEIVIRTILRECYKLRDELVPAEELQRAKDHMIGGLLLGLETSDEIASFYGGEELLTRALLPPSAVMDRIKKVTAEEIRSVARAIFKRNGLNLAAIGPYRSATLFKKILNG
jgi:predicted Zn-dependent peptidase